MIILSQITILHVPNQDQRLNTQNALGTIIYNEQDHNRCLINILATATREDVCMGEWGGGWGSTYFDDKIRPRTCCIYLNVGLLT